MEPLRETTHYREEICEPRTGRVSWPAIFGGTLIMLVTLMLLSLLGLGIGISAINPMEEARPLQGIGTGALIWWIISNLLAIFAGAVTAAKLTNVTYHFSGVLHGILTWSLYSFISIILLTSSIGGIISGVGGAVSKSLSAVGVGASELASLTDQVNTDRIKVLIQDALAEDQELGSGAQGRQFDIDLMAVIQEVFIEDGEINTNIERDKVEKSVAKNSTLSRDDAGRAADVIARDFSK